MSSDVTGAVEWAAAHLGVPVVEAVPLLGGLTSTMLALTGADGSRAVLRLVDTEPWRTHGAGLVTREAVVQGQLAATPVPAPASLALDPDGTHCGHPAHLMTLLPGSVDTHRVAPARLDELAATLATIHAVRVDPPPRTYQPWAWEAKYVVPAWAADPPVWEGAFEALRADPPSYEPTLLHRDFHLRNVLWDGPHVSGVVDWVETSTGPAWLDVAHCRTNLAIDHGDEVADAFVAAYVGRTGREADGWWDVLDTVGFLPRPGTPHVTDDPTRLARLDAHLRHVLDA